MFSYLSAVSHRRTTHHVVVFSLQFMSTHHAVVVLRTTHVQYLGVCDICYYSSTLNRGFCQGFTCWVQWEGTGEADRKRHFSSISSPAATAKKHPFVPPSEDKNWGDMFGTAGFNGKELGGHVWNCCQPN